MDKVCERFRIIEMSNVNYIWNFFLNSLGFLIVDAMFLHLRPKCKVCERFQIIGVTNVNCVCRIFSQAVKCIDAMFLHPRWIKFAKDFKLLRCQIAFVEFVEFLVKLSNLSMFLY